ncbi:hypothetical protein QBC37DRAFT_432023 [Rhypophila decipiens]|uniref:NmrA-like domain-containing protein n=1 Tax=Rhypophila decipiens TaxID=261697 RepID=A0AAN7B2F4_9PEZI|nr:hypothetical protein QBC37DRAFT_432023 [Rhypophila decipiens]
MVEIAVAGGSGELAREIIDVLLATKKHEITILSRRDAAPEEVIDGTTWQKVDFHDKDSLVPVLNGVHTVLSFILCRSDVDHRAQKTLIAACIESGVKRFAPNEWSTSDVTASDGYAPKLGMREYLASINAEKKVLEYTLFQPGLFMNYLGAPLKTTNHVSTSKIQFDLEFRRAILVGDVDPPEQQRLTLTSIKDIANVVSLAIDYEGEWPVVGGMAGETLSVWEVLRIAEKVRGPFTVDKVNLEDLKAGKINASWTPCFDHPSVKAVEIAEAIPLNLILSNAWGAWVVSDEWNKLLPGYKFTGVEEFIREVWSGQP